MSQRINPYRLFVGSHIPNWLLCRTELNAGAKLVYAQLAQYRDSHPKLETVATQLGMSKRQLCRQLTALQRHNLIERAHPGSGQAGRYVFVDRHEWMVDYV